MLARLPLPLPIASVEIGTTQPRTNQQITSGISADVSSCGAPARQKTLSGSRLQWMGIYYD